MTVSTDFRRNSDISPVFSYFTMPRVAQVPRPQCGTHDVLLRVAACGICGCDARSYFTGDKFTGARRIPGMNPRVLWKRWVRAWRHTTPATVLPWPPMSIATSAGTADTNCSTCATG